MDEEIAVLAGDCTIVDEGSDRIEYRGRVVTVIKPDDTVLVHDVSGYQPVAWLTRADRVSAGDGDIEARKDDRRLVIRPHETAGRRRYTASQAGRRVGTCPDCGGALIEDGDAICIDCPNRYGLPADASVCEQRCDCGLPRISVARGRRFDLCLDRQCESLDEAVRDAFDRAWSCPDCGRDLRIIRRGGLLAGCAGYPDCDVALTIPAGVIDGDCACGLPIFSTGTGARCLDPNCEAFLTAAP